jgi:hypothetical protein
MNDIYQQTKEGISSAGEFVSRTSNNAVNYIQQTTEGALKNVEVPTVNSTREFLESNSIIARVSFLIMAIFVFVILLRLSIRIVAYFLLNKSGTVYLVNGMIDGDEPYIFPQDPNRNSNAKTIIKSNNAMSGVEFSWSCWLYVKGVSNNPNQGNVYKHVFSKGNNNWNSSNSNPRGVAYPNNAPGVYLSPDTNNLHIFMNTYDAVSERVVVKGIPLNKWFHLTICCLNKSLDVYINGIVVNSYKLRSVPKQNYGDVFVCNNGGFSGSLSNLIYYNKAISLQTIHNIVASGPNFRNMRGKLKQNDYKYLSIDWYFNNPTY